MNISSVYLLTFGCLSVCLIVCCYQSVCPFALLSTLNTTEMKCLYQKGEQPLQNNQMLSLFDLSYPVTLLGWCLTHKSP